MRTSIPHAFVPALAILGCGLAMTAMAQDSPTASVEVQITVSVLTQHVQGGQVDWGKRMMYATGEAVLADESKEPNRARALLRAKDYAKMLAIANLMMVIEGTPVNYEGSGKDLMAKDASLRRTIEGYVKNVAILKTETFDRGADRVVQVTVGTPIFGSETPGSAFLGKLADTEKPKQAPLMQIPLERSNPRPSIPTSQASPELERVYARCWSGAAASRPVDLGHTDTTAKQDPPFTSLVVDARGFSIPQAISPKIRKLNGDQVFGSVLDKSDPALKDGTVAYASSPESAMESDRCGRSPLMVTAVGRGGGRSMCDVVVSDDDAKAILRENASTSFLDQYKVIFVIDPPGSAMSAGPSQMARAQ